MPGYHDPPTLTAHALWPRGRIAAGYPAKEDPMFTANRWSRVLVGAGLVAMAAGALDPLEGAPVIVAGTLAAAAGASLGGSRHRKTLMLAAALVALGVALMWAASAVGGFGGKTGRPIWLGMLLILPYPAGWLLGLVAAVRSLRERPAPPDA